MPGLTKGGLLAARLDAPVGLPADPHWSENNPVPNVGYRAPITAAQIEAHAEAELEARTWGGFRHAVCPDCRMALTTGEAAGTSIPGPRTVPCTCDCDGREWSADEALTLQGLQDAERERLALLRWVGLA